MPTQLLFRPEDFSNQLDLLSMTSSEIERQVVSYTLSFPQIRDQKVERGIKFPQFVSAFYNFIYKEKRLPTQQNFCDFYFAVNHSFFVAHNFSEAILLGLRARIFRTYPSLVRDFHFNKILSELARDYKIIYNSILDIEHDIDTMLIKGDQYWAACLYTETKRANIAREWKEHRHERFLNVHYIELPVTLGEDNKHGQFFLYGEREMNLLLNKIQSTTNNI